MEIEQELTNSRMPESKTALIKYIFVDIVNYSLNRTVEAQTEIIDLLNFIVKTSVQENRLSSSECIYLPAGDGICIALINIIEPYDLHILISLRILEKLANENSKQQKENRRFSLRIGVNENHDNLIIDINGKASVAGSGINHAQRIMSISGENQIFLSQAVYDKIVQRERYNGKFLSVTSEIKHNLQIHAYRFVDSDIEYLNSDPPTEIASEDSNGDVYFGAVIYCAVIAFYEKEIASLNEIGIARNSLMLLCAYITDDIIDYIIITDAEKIKWKSRVFPMKAKTFTEAYKLIRSCLTWVLFDAFENKVKRLKLDQIKNGGSPYHLFLRPEDLQSTITGNEDVFEEATRILKLFYTGTKDD